MKTNTNKISKLEFICLMAFLMALASFSIDALLPGLEDIGDAIGITDHTLDQFLILVIVLGLGIGQLFSGALSDSIGRKPVMYIGCILFAIASLVCVFSNSFEIMIVGRLLQGVGLSAPRSVTTAIIRDQYKGNAMAQIMSYIMVVFIIAPIIAPTFGKFLLDSFGWESIFYSQLIFGLIITFWLWLRQPETLKKEDKKAMNWSLYTNGLIEFFKDPRVITYTLIVGIIQAPFLSYMSASQHIFSQQYDLGDIYPYIFSGLAISIGFATFLNGTLVMRFGMKRMAVVPMVFMLAFSILYVVLFNRQTNPDSTIFIGFLAITLFLVGFVFGNLNALAMEPIGHIAGIGSSINGFISTIVAVIISTIIGQFIHATALPIFMGFGICVAISLLMIQMLGRTKKNEETS